jgi:hypothetical protein
MTTSLKSPSPREKLEAMDVNARIAVVADDVESRRDEYRSIEPYDLADLLGAPAALQPANGDWDFTWYVPRPSIEDLFYWHDGSNVFPGVLEGHVTDERLSTLIKHFTVLDGKQSLTQQDFAFMTDFEKDLVITEDMERNAEDISGPSVLAQYVIKAASGKTLRFEVSVGCGGESDNPKTPYDDRDGNFTDLSDARIVQ